MRYSFWRHYVDIWNSLPNSVVGAKSLRSFKKRLMDHPYISNLFLLFGKPAATTDAAAISGFIFYPPKFKIVESYSKKLIL